jgi:hypothetical protein
MVLSFMAYHIYSINDKSLLFLLIFMCDPTSLIIIAYLPFSVRMFFIWKNQKDEKKKKEIKWNHVWYNLTCSSTAYVNRPLYYIYGL